MKPKGPPLREAHLNVQVPMIGGQEQEEGPRTAQNTKVTEMGPVPL